MNVETSNWWTSTHPQSPFVSGLIAAVHHPGGSRELISDLSGSLELKVQSPSDTHVSELPREKIAQVLADRFALPGFALVQTVACGDRRGCAQLIGAGRTDTSDATRL